MRHSFAMWRLLSSLRSVYLAAIWYLAWWHAAFIFASTRCVKSYIAPFGLSVQKNNLVLYLMVHCTESFCLLVHEVDFTYLRAPSLLRNAKVPLTTFSTPWSMQCFKWSQNCNRLKQLPGQNSSQT